MGWNIHVLYIDDIRKEWHERCSLLVCPPAISCQACMEFTNQPVSFLAVRENMLQDVPCVQGQGLIASPLLSCTSRKSPHSCWDPTQGSALTLIPASTHCPSWALLEGVSPCPACWAEVAHRSLWSPSMLVWGWGRVGKGICKPSPLCALGTVSWTSLWAVPHSLPFGTPKGKIAGYLFPPTAWPPPPVTLRGDLQPAVLRGCSVCVKRTTLYLVPGGGTHHLGITCQACNLLLYVNSLNPQSEFRW